MSEKDREESRASNQLTMLLGQLQRECAERAMGDTAGGTGQQAQGSRPGEAGRPPEGYTGGRPSQQLKSGLTGQSQGLWTFSSHETLSRQYDCREQRAESRELRNSSQGKKIQAEEEQKWEQ